jgi:hypothetical protein
MSDAEPNGCLALAEVADQIVEAEPEVSPRDFLRALGRLVAGIEPGVEGLLDLARGGSNKISGKGFKPEFDDGSAGQARHFAGTAVSVALLGSRATELIAHTVVDPAETPDGRLSSAAIEFANLIMNEELPVSGASGWILDELCVDSSESDTS